MSLNLSLLSALSGLQTTQGAMRIVSNNTANVETEGYTRKIADETTRTLEGQGVGVSLAEARRSVDLGLIRDLREATSLNESLSVQNDFLARLEIVFGAPGDANSIASRVQDLHDSFKELVAKPEGLAQQLDVINAGKEMARTLNRYSVEIQNLRLDADRELSVSATNLSNALSRIVTLNGEISSRSTKGLSVADLEDERDRQVQIIAGEMGVSTFTDSNNRMGIITEGGSILLGNQDTSAPTVTFNAASTMAPNAFYNPNPPPASTLSGLSIGGTDITSTLQTGRMAGLFTVRDTQLMQAQVQLDDFAVVMTQAFEGTGTGFVGTAVSMFVDTPAPAPQAAFSGNPIGYSQRIQTDPVLDTDPWRVRDGTNTVAVAAQSANIADPAIPLTVLTMFETAQTFNANVDADTGAGVFNVATGLGLSHTLEGYSSEFISFQAIRKDDINQRYDFQDVYTKAINQRKLDDSGVNLDQEMASLLELQNAYAASARVINTVQEMFDQLLSLR